MRKVNIKSDNNMSTVCLVYNGSTFNERKGIYGISHLMEHLIFKGTDKYMNIFQEDGIDSNAFTDSNRIVFYMTGLSKYINKHKDSFIEGITNFSLTEEVLQNEKNIVLQEYDDYFNEISSYHMLNLFRKKYGYYDPIGLKEDLKNLTLQDCMNFYKLQYASPSNIVIVDRKVKTEIDPYVKTNYIGMLHDKFIYEPSNNFEKKVSFIALSQEIYDPKENMIMKIISNILSDGLNSPLYEEIREKLGLVYYIRMGIQKIFDEKSVLMFDTASTKENIPVIHNKLKEVFLNPDKYLTKSRFDIVMKSIDIDFQKLDCLKFGIPYIINEIADPEKSFKLNYKSITFDDVQTVYKKYFVDGIDNWYFSSSDTEFNDVQIVSEKQSWWKKLIK